MKAVVLACVAACSVPDLELDGKQCPCTEGYACDTSTNLCRPTNGDGGFIDTPSATPCLPAGSNVELYRYAGMFDWATPDGTWSGDAVITQSSSNAMGAYAFRTQQELTAAMGNYRVIATLRQTKPGSGTPSLGVVLRAQLADKARYQCNWLPEARELRVDAIGGGGATTLKSMVVTNASTTAAVTMEASIAGNPPALACCLREYATARLMNVTDAASTAMGGYPGLATDRMSATFPSFVVLQP